MWAAAQTATDEHNEVLLALVAIISLAVGALVYVIKNNGIVKGIAVDAAQVNAAVNHKDTGELSLYRLASENSKKLDLLTDKQNEFDRKWGNLPPDIGDAVSLNEVLHLIQRQIADIQAELVQHVAWEQTVKYDTHDPT